MEIERGGAGSRARRNMGPPAKSITPVNKKKSVSVAAVFKQPPCKTEQSEMTPYAKSTVSRLITENAVAQPASVKSPSSSRSPQKAAFRVSKNRSDMHPLAVAFRDTSDGYRRHLYRSTTLKIKKTLEALLTTLYKRTLQTISTHSSQEDPNASPLQLSAPARYEQMAIKLHQPLSLYQLSLRRTNMQGEKERFQASLETRMKHYEDHIAKRTNEIMQLQRVWEAVVGEIWELGVGCLGEGVMKNLLFTDDGALGLSSSPTEATEPESTLFVPEQDTSPPPRKIQTRKKHVTFEDADVFHKNDAVSVSKFPDFLYQPSKYHDQLPIAPPLEEQEIKTVEMQVKQLGKAEIDELRKIEKDHQAYWRKKAAQVAVALKDD